VSSVCLFSSNIRPQYEQDIIDVAAAPAGHVVRFRYETRYVDDQIREAWSGNRLTGRDALVLYSIQQPQNYHPPAFIPVRHAIVASSTTEGSVCVIDFRLGGYAVLRDPAGADETRGAIVSDFTARLSSTLLGHPGHGRRDRRFSATGGSVPSGFIAEGLSEAEDFERLSSYLVGTVSFASHSLWRISAIREVGDRESIEPNREGRWRLQSNATYEIVITHYQPDVGGRSFGFATARFDLATDASLVEIIGDKQFEVASRYDAIPIRLRVPSLTEVKETVLTIRPHGETKGPRADVRLIVGPTKGKRAAGGAMAGAAVVLATIPGMMDKTAGVWDKIWFPVLAAILTFALGWWALPVRRG